MAKKKTNPQPELDRSAVPLDAAPQDDQESAEERALRLEVEEILRKHADPRAAST